MRKREQLRKMRRPNPNNQPIDIKIDTVACQEPDRVKIIEQIMADLKFINWYPGKDGPVDHETIRERMLAKQQNKPPMECRVWEAD